MTIDDVVAELKTESIKNSASRFPCRAIMVRNIERYCELLEKLKQIPNVEIVPASSLFSHEDVMPRFENLTTSAYASKWMLLTGVSEYLRLFSKNEAESQRFAKLWCHQSPASSTGRIIIPLWGCEAQWYDQSLHLTDDIRQQDFYYNCIDSADSEQRLSVTVFSEEFRQYKNQLEKQCCHILDGLQMWYEYWSNPLPKEINQILITARTRLIPSVDGNITIHIVKNILSLLQENMHGGHNLSIDNCPDEAQKCLFKVMNQGKSLDDAILTSLNISIFSAVDVSGKWNTLSLGQKQLVRLWYDLHPDESYFCHCIRNVQSLSDVEKRVLHEIFSVHGIPVTWLAESQSVMKAMKLVRDDEYFHALNQIPNYSDKLDYLSAETARERTYIIEMVGHWLVEDRNQVMQCEKLRCIYPALYAYLNGSEYDEELQRYMGLYKMYKLSNTLPIDEQMYFADIQTSNYDFRYASLSAFLADQTIVLWIDALGVEWLPLLLWSLNKCNDGKVIKFMVGQASLPTETEFNKQWEQMTPPYRKLDRLDKLAHKGVIDDPSYYSCVENQIEFISGISSQVSTLIETYHRVIITGDHGTSRLAARFFHKRDGIPLNKSGKVMSHGRYGLVPLGIEPTLSYQTVAKDDSGSQYIVFSNYDHFKQSGFAAGADDENAIYGEIHGGATPEEMLVPIIVFESTKPLPLSAKWKKNPIKISMKKARATVCFSQPIQVLQAMIGTNHASVSISHDKKEWVLEFAGIKAGTYPITMIADGKLVAIEELTIESALGNKDGDIW